MCVFVIIIIFLETTPHRIKTVIDELNFEFQCYVEKEKDINSAYTKMVSRNPFRVLSDYTYDAFEEPLKGAEQTKMPSLTDVSCNFFFFVFTFIIIYILCFTNFLVVAIGWKFL